MAGVRVWELIFVWVAPLYFLRRESNRPSGASGEGGAKPGVLANQELAMALKTAFFLKNVPGWERVLRVMAGTAVAVMGAFTGGPWTAAGIATGVGFALTGFFGFCPMCAMVGRRLSSKS